MDDLKVYEMQLHQVEAALITDPNNYELLKLKDDLEELIKLAREVIQSEKLEKKSAGRKESDVKSISVLASQWKVGYQCMAPWSEDGKYYKATIDSIDEDGTVHVTFEEYQNKDTAKLSQLRDWEAAGKSKKRKASNDMDSDQQREYKKKRKQKKFEYFQKVEEEKEQEKNKWLTFSNKLSKKGLMKKSIFSTPEGMNGRVGVGTCGVSGKEMTKFSNAENKWKRGF